MQRFCLQEKSQQGFTLIEVLIALVIIAIGIAAVMASVSSSIRGATHLRQQLAMSWAAESVLARMQADELKLSVATGKNISVNELDRDWSVQTIKKDSTSATTAVLIIVTPEKQDKPRWQMRGFISKRINTGENDRENDGENDGENDDEN